MIYKFKALRHKERKDIFGVFLDYEIGHVATPSYLLGEATEMHILKNYWKGYPMIVAQLSKYELIDIEVKIAE